MLGVTITKLRRRSTSPAIAELVSIVDRMVNDRQEFSYGEIARKLFGDSNDPYFMMACVWKLQRMFSYMRRKFKLHIYQIEDKLVVLRTTQQFNTIINSHEERIKDYRRIIRTLVEDRDDYSYNSKIKERFEAWKMKKEKGD